MYHMHTIYFRANCINLPCISNLFNFWKFLNSLKHDSHLRSFESKSGFLNCISIKIAAVDCNTANSIKFQLSLFVIESLHLCNFFMCLIFNLTDDATLFSNCHLMANYNPFILPIVPNRSQP